MPDEEYVDPEFPEMEPLEEISVDPEGNPELEELDEGLPGETPIPHDFEDLVDMGLVPSSPVEPLDEEQVELIASSPDSDDVSMTHTFPPRGVPSVKEAFAVMPFSPREDPVVMYPESGGVLFLPEDDPLRRPKISEPLDPRLVYTRPVPKRLRHLTCERRGQEYHKPVGRYRPGS